MMADDKKKYIIKFFINLPGFTALLTHVSDVGGTHGALALGTNQLGPCV